MSKYRTAYLGLGTNIGNRERNLKEAVKLLKAIENIEVIKASSVYETEPVGVKEQPWFYNCVVEIGTSLPPEQLLSTVKNIEQTMGRERTEKWGPRLIDIDILTYENQAGKDSSPILPHPEITKRAFVLMPLAEIAPNLSIKRDMTAKEILKKLTEHEKIIKTEHLILDD